MVLGGGGGGGYNKFERFAADCIDLPSVQEDSEFALFSGILLLGLCARRQCLFLCLANCWPHRRCPSPIFADGGALTANECRTYRHNLEFWSTAESKCHYWNDLPARCWLPLACVRQLLGAYIEMKLARTSYSSPRTGPGNIVESINKTQGRCHPAKGSVKFLRPPWWMAAPIAAYVATVARTTRFRGRKRRLTARS